METSFFTWSSWNIVDSGDSIYEFFGVTLLVDIGTLKKGQKFRSACMDFQNGVMEFYYDVGIAATFDLTFNAKQR